MIWGRTYKERIGRQRTEILFLERCWAFLKESKGRLAIIIPDGILTNKTLHYVRTFLKEKFEIEGIFSIPQVTFIHYGAGLKSSILLLRKRAKDESEHDNDVFCALASKVGYDATGRKDRNELPTIAKKFREFQRGRDFGEHNVFVRKVSDLDQNRLDAYYYSPLFDEILAEIHASKYPLRPLKDICQKVRIGKKDVDGIFNGSTPAKDNYSENASDPKIIKVASLKASKVDFDFVENVDPDFVSDRTVEDKDILMLSSAHQADYLGRNPCIVEMPDELADDEITFVGELINVRVDKSLVNPYYILQLFNTRNYYLLINREKRGQTSHLYPSDLKHLVVPVPEDLAFQNENAEKYIQNYKEYERLVEKANALLQETYDEFESEFLDTSPEEA